MTFAVPVRSTWLPVSQPGKLLIVPERTTLWPFSKKLRLSDEVDSPVMTAFPLTLVMSIFLLSIVNAAELKTISELELSVKRSLRANVFLIEGEPENFRLRSTDPDALLTFFRSRKSLSSERRSLPLNTSSAEGFLKFLCSFFYIYSIHTRKRE